ncbi:MAG: phage minor capsid protein [Turicibacter sanguinis]
MLSPDYFVGADKQIQKYLTRLENDVLRDVARHLKTATAKNQMEALVDLDHSVFTMAMKLSEFSDKSLSEIIDIMDDAGIKSYYDDKELYSKGKTHLPDYKDNLSAMKFVEAIKRQSGNDLKNITRTTGLAGKGLNEFYRTELSQAVLNLRSGAFSSDQVIRQMVNKCADRGLVSINYASGRTMRVESAVRMCINTGFRQLTTQMGFMNAELVGQDLMEISAHAGARPTHQEWQGQIVSLSGKPNYLSLNDIGYGSADGFSGVNCRHSWYPYFEGISEPLYTDFEEPQPFEYKGKTYTGYDANQHIRKLENSIKKEKRKITMYDELGDEESVTTHKVRAQRLRQERDKFQEHAKVYRTNVSRYNNTKPEKVIKNKTFEVFDDIKTADVVHRPQTIEYWNQWSNQEKYSLYDYTSNSYPFNDPLREGGTIGERIKNVMSALDKCSLEQNTVVFRGVDERGFRAFMGLDDSVTINEFVKNKDAFIGEYKVDKAFVSTGVNSSGGFTRKPINYEIRCPKGTKGAYLEPFSYYGKSHDELNWDGKSYTEKLSDKGENEFLIQAGTPMKILDITKKGRKLKIVMEVIVK